MQHCMGHTLLEMFGECIIKEGAELGVPLMPDGHVVYICNREGNYLSFRLIVYLTTGVSMITQLTS